MITVISDGQRAADGECIAPLLNVMLAPSDRTGIELVVGADKGCRASVNYFGPPRPAGSGEKLETTQVVEIIGVTTDTEGEYALLTTSPDTCRSEHHRRDIANVTLTGVNHSTRWSYGGSVALQWMATETRVSGGTGWRVTSGPSHWVVDGNGGSSDRTHGQASFEWYNQAFQHTLTNENKVYSSGACEGFFTAVGSVPGTGWWHYSVVITE